MIVNRVDTIHIGGTRRIGETVRIAIRTTSISAIVDVAVWSRKAIAGKARTTISRTTNGQIG